MSPELMASDRRGGGLTSHRWTRFKFGSLLLGLGRCHVLGPASSLVTGLCPSHLWGPSDALGGRKDRGARAGQTQQFSPVSRPGRGRGRSAGAVGGPPAGVARRIQRWEGLGPRAGARDEESRPRSACRNGIRVRAPVPPRSFPESPLSLRGQERPPCARATSHLVTASSRRPGPKCHRRGCCPLARAESPPRPDIPLCLPPWLGRPPWPTPPSALCPLGQRSARTSGLRTFPVPSPFWPQPRPPWAAPAHAPAHCACLWGHLFPPRPHALGGGDQVTLLPVGCQFPAHSQT